MSSPDGVSTQARDEAFTAVFQAHHRACLRLARRVVRDESLADDVVQDVFLAWWRSDGGGYRPERGELATWLSTITHHKAVDALRTSERQRRVLTSVPSAVPPQERPVDDVVWWGLGTQSLLAALPVLSPKHREVLGLAYVTGLTQVEIAARLGIPLGTVKSRTHTAMLRLREAICGSWTPSGPTAEPQPPGDLARIPAARRRPGEAAADAGLGDDVRRCVAALTRLAGQDEGASADGAIVRRAAALVDAHGEAGVRALVVALARAAAAGRTTSDPTAPGPRAQRRVAGAASTAVASGQGGRGPGHLDAGGGR